MKVAHIEASLRSFDNSMPEEINRILTDRISDLLLIPSRDGNENLLREGIAPEKIRFVGNVMIDTLVRLLPKAEMGWSLLRDQHGLDRYILVTLHRPSNVDEPEVLRQITEGLTEISRQIAVVFPVHPRTRSRISALGLMPSNGGIIFTEPLGYLGFLALQKHANLVITDSGGVQEETTYLGVPCLTARPNTERPVTINNGTNQLVASTAEALIAGTNKALNDGQRTGELPELWDGSAAKRIVDIFRNMG